MRSKKKYEASDRLETDRALIKESVGVDRRISGRARVDSGSALIIAFYSFLLRRMGPIQ